MRATAVFFASLCVSALLALPLPVDARAAEETVSAADLRQAFADDRDGAEKKYVGKTIRVTGVVVSTGMSIYLTPNVVLSDKEQGAVKVICVLPRIDTGKLSEFKPGQRVTMSGRGYRLSDRGVVLKECKQVD